MKLEFLAEVQFQRFFLILKTKRERERGGGDGEGERETKGWSSME